jgi:hypothetical protein
MDMFVRLPAKVVTVTLSFGAVGTVNWNHWSLLMTHGAAGRPQEGVETVTPEVGVAFVFASFNGMQVVPETSNTVAPHGWSLLGGAGS